MFWPQVLDSLLLAGPKWWEGHSGVSAGGGGRRGESTPTPAPSWLPAWPQALLFCSHSPHLPATACLGTLFPSAGLLAQGDNSSLWVEQRTSYQVKYSRRFPESSGELPCCHFCGLEAFSVALGVIQPGGAESARKPFCTTWTCCHPHTSVSGLKTMV